MSSDTDIVSDIIDWQNGELDADDEVRVLQSLIDSGNAWKLEGSVGRACMDAIEAGLCTLGPTH